ncbi:MAG: B12-binding domain-containing radical SAM protein [Bacteroidetes bacterium]|nr:B12-binding domain-containing radical SAM protein [Bacteroidota bacterium]
MKQSRDIIFITFDIRKDEYPSMSYSIAALIASLKQYNYQIGHFSIDLQHTLEEKPDESTITEMVRKRFLENLDYFRTFRFIAISLTSWSIEYCQVLLNLMAGYEGKIILGGYEVTSMSEERLLSNFPQADYFIKGFAEKVLNKLIAGDFPNNSKVLEEKIELKDLASPYLTGVIPIFSKKIHWETKRGCPYTCGFCEWGKATKNIIQIDQERLFKEIELFKETGINEINILDGTFNFGKYFLEIFRKLFEIPDVRITCQARFENLSGDTGEEFLKLCVKNKERVHLEFGLQTIHPKEMEMIGRTNDLEKVLQAMNFMRINTINFETSIIYAIPGQTVESFIDTIEFLLLNGCNTIRAYPLSIPKNSSIECRKADYDVIEGKNKYNVFSVISTSSFSEDNRNDMYRIANYLIDGGLIISELSAEDHRIKTKEITPYQRELVFLSPDLITPAFEKRLRDDYLGQTMSDMSRDDVLQGIGALGRSYMHRKEMNVFFSDIISGKFSFELKNQPKPDDSDKNNEPMVQAIIDKIKPNIIPRRYRCRVRLGLSGNVYIFREIQNSQAF